MMLAVLFRVFFIDFGVIGLKLATGFAVDESSFLIIFIWPFGSMRIRSVDVKDTRLSIALSRLTET